MHHDDFGLNDRKCTCILDIKGTFGNLSNHLAESEYKKIAEMRDEAVLEALEAAGLDIVSFASWCRRFGFEIWPRTLPPYFMAQQKAQQGYFGPYGVSYFKHMGILETHCQAVSGRFWKTFNVAEWGIDPLFFRILFRGSQRPFIGIPDIQ